MKNFSIIIAIVFIGMPGVVMAETLVGRVNEWAPLYYKESGRWTGISVDAYEALTKEAGLSLELKILPWSRALIEMRTKPIMLANLTPTDERRKTMHFIGPHHYEVIGLAVAAKYADEKIENLEDLVGLVKRSGRKIGYQRDVQISKEFNGRIKIDPNFKSHFHIYSSRPSIIKMVITGRLTGFIGTLDSMTYELKGKNNYESIRIHPFTLSKTAVYVGVSKSISDVTLKKLLEANDRLKSNGTWDGLIKKWAAQ